MPSPMTCSSRTPPPAHVASPLALRILDLVRHSWRAYWDWRARQATVMILRSLDHRTLRDIGISPGEIESLVRCSDGRRRPYDASWLWRRSVGQRARRSGPRRQRPAP